MGGKYLFSDHTVDKVSSNEILIKISRFHDNAKFHSTIKEELKTNERSPEVINLLFKLLCRPDARYTSDECIKKCPWFDGKFNVLARKNADVPRQINAYLNALKLAKLG